MRPDSTMSLGTVWIASMVQRAMGGMAKISQGLIGEDEDDVGVEIETAETTETTETTDTE